MKTPKELAAAAMASSPVPEAQARNMWSMIVNQGVPHSPHKTYQKRWRRFQKRCAEEFFGLAQTKGWKDQMAVKCLMRPWVPDTDVI